MGDGRVGELLWWVWAGGWVWMQRRVATSHVSATLPQYSYALARHRSPGGGGWVAAPQVTRLMRRDLDLFGYAERTYEQTHARLRAELAARASVQLMAPRGLPHAWHFGTSLFGQD